MAKVAKLRRRESQSWRIWETLVRYANAPDDRTKAAQERDFETLVSYCMNWIGGDKEDIAECRDFKDCASLTALAGCGKSRLGKKARKTNRAQLPQERKKGRG